MEGGRREYSISKTKGRNIISATACREPTLNDCYVCSERIRIIHKGKSEYGNHQ